ncbi:rhomboid family intramembrane serine protease [Geothermobacter hydrogeniphilus]|nr:rhomboid family intramembrane serine protease [Geothermobacter hydrogeniphilus]
MTPPTRSGILSAMEEQQQPPPFSQPEWQPIRPDLAAEGEPLPLSRRQFRSWSLVLEARGFLFQAEPCGPGWLLWVPDESFARARAELRLYEQENHNWPPPLPPLPPPSDHLLGSLLTLLAVGVFFDLTLQPIRLAGHQPVDWVGLGNAHAGKILAGEWWRLVTSLTLHSGWLHLLGNLLIGSVFIIRLCRDLGAGLGWSLLLAAGALGNLVNALLQDPAHRAVGASTAIFGAVGLLAAISLVRYRHHLRRRWPLPIAAALGLLALLGSSGENTDLGAHLFGFACGFGLGLGAEFAIDRLGRPGPNLNRLLCLSSAVLVLLAWWNALT